MVVPVDPAVESVVSAASVEIAIDLCVLFIGDNVADPWG